jgi:hypothetical protein
MHFHARGNEQDGAIFPILNAHSHGIEVAAGGSKDTPPVGQINSHHSLLGVAQDHAARGPPPYHRRERPAQASRVSFCATPNCTRQRNKSPVAILCLPATPETVAPGCPLSSAIASFCPSLKRRLAGVVGTCGTSYKAAVVRPAGRAICATHGATDAELQRIRERPFRSSSSLRHASPRTLACRGCARL